MKCRLLEADKKYKGVVAVEVPGIYGRRGDPLPKSMARLVRPAAQALARAYKDIVAEGGHLYISDMFRTAAQQQKAHEDWKTGRKTAFSPPAGGSVHEGARAIDIDAFDTGIGHKRVREILNSHGWVNIVDTLSGPECWHYEFRGDKWEQVRQEKGYRAMAEGMIEAIGNKVTRPDKEEAAHIRWVQESLNRLMGMRLEVDGILGERTRETVREFQRRTGLLVDGIPGPITSRRIREALDRH